MFGWAYVYRVQTWNFPFVGEFHVVFVTLSMDFQCPWFDWNMKICLTFFFWVEKLIIRYELFGEISDFFFNIEDNFMY